MTRPGLTSGSRHSTSQGVTWRVGLGAMTFALMASAAFAASPSSTPTSPASKVQEDLVQTEHEAAAILAEAKSKANQNLADAQDKYHAWLAKIDQKLADAAAKGGSQLVKAEAKATDDRAKAEADLAKARTKIDTELAEAQANADDVITTALQMVDDEILEVRLQARNAPVVLEALDGLADAELEAGKALDNALAMSEEKLTEAQEKYDAALAKIDQKLADAAVKGGSKLVKAEAKATDDRAKAEADLAKAKTKIDTDLAKAQAIADDDVKEARDGVDAAISKADQQAEKLVEKLTEICSSSAGYSAERTIGSMYNVNQYVGADDLWHQGYTGAGVDIAVIDTGTVPVEGLDGAKVIYGPDFSLETHQKDAHQLDTYGHGTHMAGIIAGNDYDTEIEVLTPGEFQGVAPDARIVSVKVADATGAVDPSQVMAAVDWVIAHRNDNGMNIRVINLSYRAAGTQAYTIDPLAKAVEKAWEAGIVVVVAAGNDGEKSTKLGNPGYDPFVITVSAILEKEQAKSGCLQDEQVWVTTDYASKANKKERQPDLYAPGSTIVSLRNPGSFVDTNHPKSAVGDRYTKGTGTSQSTAVVSGAVALLLDARPELTPDQVKAILVASADDDRTPILDIEAALTEPVPGDATQTWPRSTGLGSLEATRGGEYIFLSGKPLTGENTVIGPWNPKKWINSSGAAWSGATWSGATWSGATWSGATWSGATWSGATWSGATWSGATWSGATWSGATWD